VGCWRLKTVRWNSKFSRSDRQTSKIQPENAASTTTLQKNAAIAHPISI
jgi:hypothetical protein